MKVTIEEDNGKETVFEKVTDAYLCVRQMEPYQGHDELSYLPETKSFSWGYNLRELIKELTQSLDELREHLRGRPK